LNSVPVTRTIYTLLATNRVHLQLKYSEIMSRYSFVPIVFETLDPINSAGTDFIDDIGRRTHTITGDNREVFSVTAAVHGDSSYNAICFRGTFSDMAFQRTRD